MDWHIPQFRWDAMVGDGEAWQLVVPDWLPMSMNDLIKNSWNTYAGERRWIQHYLSTHYREVPPAMGKRAIEMMVVKSSGQYDDEPNLDGRSKATVDAMKKLGMVRDDNRKWLEWHHVKEWHGARKGLVIRLWEVG